jgi:hypothetical protein
MSHHIRPYVLRGMADFFSMSDMTLLFVMIISISLKNGHKVRDLAVCCSAGQRAYGLQ